MKSSTAAVALGALILAAQAKPDVDETYPYTGPDIPVGDWSDPSVNGNGKGFPRLVEPPAVKPAKANPTNNVNVISLAYVPQGINIHYQTPFGLGVAPSVKWGASPEDLNNKVTGYSHTYDRTPPCSMIAAVTQCSQFFHEVQIKGLTPGTKYYYQIPAANGTTKSDVLSFTTARGAGEDGEFTIAVLNDMGYTNAGGTYKQLIQAVDDGAAFAWHGGDISYADDWYSGILPCEDDWPVCYNSTSTSLPGNFPIPDEYKTPIPEGEVANQGGPHGGDMGVLYESNWDLWQQWINSVSAKVPYMVLPGNHEATCAEFDGPNNVLTAYLNDDIANGTAEKSELTYYSCPPSQRNFTAYQHRFRMPGMETGGVGNMWYSFDYGLAHFIALDGETDFANSPEWSFARDTKGSGEKPTEDQTYVTDSGPFGAVGDYNDTKTYAQYQWLEKDLAGIDRSKTPWVIAMTHRPMYSSQVSSYQANVRAAFQELLIENGVDIYLSGHIHWYERLWPMTNDGAIDTPSIINNNTYYTNPGVSMTHIINGMAGNIESHSTLNADQQPLNITAVLDFEHFGFTKLKVFNATALSMTFIKGQDGTPGDEVTLIKKSSPSNSTTSACTSATSVPTYSATPIVTTTTEIVTSYTTYCPGPTTITEGSNTYTVTEATTLTITNCPCTLTHTVTSTPAPIYTSTYVPVSNGTVPTAPSAPSMTGNGVSTNMPPVPGAAGRVSAGFVGMMAFAVGALGLVL